MQKVKGKGGHPAMQKHNRGTKFTNWKRARSRLSQVASNFTVIRFLWVSAKFGTCTVVSVNLTIDEDKMRRFKGECAQLSFHKWPIYTHDGASAKFRTKSQEMDNSVGMIVAAFRFLHQIFAKFHSVSSRNFLNANHYYPESAQQGTYAMNECIFQTK